MSLLQVGVMCLTICLLDAASVYRLKRQTSVSSESVASEESVSSESVASEESVSSESVASEESVSSESGGRNNENRKKPKN